MPITEEDNTRLMWAILSQRTNNGKLEGVDWGKVATDMGINKSHTAYCRWDALFKSLKAKGLPGTGPSDGTPTTPAASKIPTPKKAKTANPKARSAVKKPRSGKGGKVAKIYEDENEDNIEQESSSERSFMKAEKNEEVNMGYDSEYPQENEIEPLQQDEFYDALTMVEEDFEA